MPCDMNLALFDLDHTLIPFDSNTAWLNYLVAAGALEGEEAHARNRAFARAYQDGSFDARAYHRFTAGLLAPHERSALEQWRRAFRDEIEAQCGKALAGSRELVERHRANGDLCCIVTTTNRFVAQVFSEIFRIAHVVATEAATVDGLPDARFTGGILGDPCFGAAKVDHVSRWLRTIGRSRGDFGRIIFYSDSWNDLPLLQWADEAIAVNPDPKLQAEATARGWQILQTR